jgi:Xaa-Pro aminopeptidase
VPDTVIYADSVRSPEMRHEVPVPVPDPFLYIEHDGARHAVVTSFETPRIAEVAPDIVLHPYEEFGWDELRRQGMEREEVYLHVCARACETLGVTDAIVPSTFPVEFADHLRNAGVRIRVDRRAFSDRRRVKNDVELSGIRRAQRAAEAAFDAARAQLRQGGPGLTCERVKEAIADVLLGAGMIVEDFIVSHGPQTAVGHELGSGPIAPGEPVVIDLWPKDRETACYADMTRTYVIGDPPAEIAEYHRLTSQALTAAFRAVRAGVPSRQPNDAVCDVYEAAGYPTIRSKQPGEVLVDGFFHGTGHGVGLEVHELPHVSIDPGELQAGDVITLEPGLYRSGLGGVRLEDLVLVTEQGAETLTEYPYDLAP